MSLISIPDSENGVLPLYKRNRPSFEQLFGVEAGKVIPSMNVADDDVPEQTPKYSINVKKVGIKRENVPVKILDPFGSGIVSSIDCSVACELFLSLDKRGIHTSRIGDAIARSITNVYDDLQAFTKHLVETLIDSQFSDNVSVNARGKFSYLEEVEGWKEKKNKLSLEHISLWASSCKQGNTWQNSSGLGFENITACPCVQNTYRHAIKESGGSSPLSMPLITHSQRCITSVEILNTPDVPLPINAIISGLDQCIFRVQNTLPREHELSLVYRSHKNPQFVEDVVREVAVSVCQILGNEFAESSVRITSESCESIHEFNLYADLELSIKDYLLKTKGTGNGNGNGNGSILLG